jgi:putative redox protein
LAVFVLPVCNILKNQRFNRRVMSRDMIITFEGGKKVNAEFKGFTIETDQSEYAGGEGSAPEPFMLFLASIGTCAGIYVFSFCQSREIPTDGVRVVQSHFPKETGKGIGKIVLTIEVPPDFPEKYKSALVNAANLCAVKKHILDPPVFEVVTATTAS